MLDKQITQALTSVITELYDAADITISLEKTPKEFDGDYTLVVFPLLKRSKKKPEITAEEIGARLIEKHPIIDTYNVIKGFLNLTVTNHALCHAIAEHDCKIPPITKTSEPYLVEYSSPNTNKPLHLGHIRNNLLGYSTSQILMACGYNVKMIQIINDRGIHICKSMLAWQQFGHGETPDSTGIKGDHFVGKYYVEYEKAYRKQVNALIDSGVSQEEAEQEAPLNKAVQEMLRQWENKDPETITLWKTMNQWVYEGFKTTYQQLGVHFDKNYYESDTYLLGKQVIQEGLKKKIFYQKPDGSVWIDLTEHGLDHKILLRSDGTSVYMTQDIGTAIARYHDYKFDSMIYTVADEQDYHFQVLFIILEKLGYTWAKNCHHLSYGMVTLPSGKMKSREGTVVDGDDLMLQMTQTAQEIAKSRTTIPNDQICEQIGMAALKYQLLKVDPKKQVLFDPKESIDFHGKTGPFIQYTYARIRSIIRKNGKSEPFTFPKSLRTEERIVIKKALDYQNQVHAAGHQRSPAILANYLYDLVKSYNSYYQEVAILSETQTQTRSFRIALSTHISRIIQAATNLLGFDVPEKM